MFNPWSNVVLRISRHTLTVNKANGKLEVFLRKSFWKAVLFCCCCCFEKELLKKCCMKEH